MNMIEKRYRIVYTFPSVFGNAHELRFLENEKVNGNGFASEEDAIKFIQDSDFTGVKIPKNGFQLMIVPTITIKKA